LDELELELIGSNTICNAEPKSRNELSKSLLAGRQADGGRDPAFLLAISPLKLENGTLKWYFRNIIN